MKKQSQDDRLNEALGDLLIALDILDEEQWSGSAGAHRGCVTCAEEEVNGEHEIDCPRALLLRKYGRQVKIRGDK